jgi:hypothetical protein
VLTYIIINNFLKKMPRTKGSKDSKPRKRRGKKTTHIRVEEEKKPYLKELAQKSIEILKSFLGK